MQKIKKVFSALCCATIFAGMFVFPSNATTQTTDHFPVNTIVIREDVSSDIALTDTSYNSELDINVSDILNRSIYWNVWGEPEYANVGGNPGAYPVGHSAHMNGDTVLNTYHYTRTYIGEIMKHGDSGRCWGSGVVNARGTFCIQDIWLGSVHIVKYGTTSD